MVNGLNGFVGNEQNIINNNILLSNSQENIVNAKKESKEIKEKINTVLTELTDKINNSTYKPKTEGVFLQIRNYVNKKKHERQKKAIINKINNLHKEINKMSAKSKTSGPDSVNEAQKIAKKLDVLLNDSRVSNMTNSSIDNFAVFQELNGKIANMWINIHESMKNLAEVEKGPKKQKPMTEKKQDTVERAAQAKARKISISKLNDKLESVEKQQAQKN